MDRRRVLKLLLACLALPLPLAAQAGQAVKRVWVSRSGSVTTVSLELTGPVAAKHFSLAAPPRLVLDLPQASLQASLNDLVLDGTAVTAVRSGITASGDLRIVLDLADSAVRGEVRSLNTGRHGLEWVLTGPPVGVAPEVAKPLARQRDLLIVVDATRRWFPEQKDLPNAQGLQLQVGDVSGSGELHDAALGWRVQAA